MAKRECKKKPDPDLKVEVNHINAPRAAERLREVVELLLRAAARRHQSDKENDEQKRD